MLTWSSWPLLDTIESTEAGVQSCLFWLTMEAAVYCAIMSPEWSPGLGLRKAGNPRAPESNWYVRRSEMLPSSERAMARWSSARAMGCAWKLPPDRIISSSGKILGLSVTELISTEVTSLI